MVLGRPRQFDIDKALDQAMQLFWRKGYEGTSLSDLTQAMGINRPSLYAAFGNKETLFHKALDRYSQGPCACNCAALQLPTARAVVEQMLHGSIDLLTDPNNPGGCLMVQGALVCGDEADPVRRDLIARRLAGEIALRTRLEQAHAEGDLPADSDPAELARYIVTITHGLSVQAASGATRESLHRVADRALQAWPKSRKKIKSNNKS